MPSIIVPFLLSLLYLFNDKLAIIEFISSSVKYILLLYKLKKFIKSCFVIIFLLFDIILKISLALFLL